MKTDGGVATLRLAFKNVLGQLYQITDYHSNAGQYQWETSARGVEGNSGEGHDCDWQLINQQVLKCNLDWH